MRDTEETEIIIFENACVKIGNIPTCTAHDFEVIYDTDEGSLPFFKWLREKIGRVFC